MDIGEGIKSLRNERGLTQEELADRAELSKGFISQVERNLTSPSISTLEDILTCLGTDLKEFFSENEDRQVVFGKEDYFLKEDEESGVSIEWIVPNAQKNDMEPIRLTLGKGGETSPVGPFEGEAFGYVISGSVILHYGGETARVGNGETFYVRCDKPHFLTSKTGAQVIWVSAPPGF